MPPERCHIFDVWIRPQATDAPKYVGRAYTVREKKKEERKKKKKEKKKKEKERIERKDRKG